MCNYCILNNLFLYVELYKTNTLKVSINSQCCSRKYLGTGAVQNICMVLFLEREH